ncbi:hypothetical protein [Nocardioides immobilis]|uniref:hypothetical protein n=1 Tax=Nocardioides immobilis TaxID=2049295 RepID=UPI0015FE4D39|nr:hypothetical protein [Nocardioides immobilis]
MRLSSIWGTCSRGAGGISSANGWAFSLPEYVSPSPPGGSQAGWSWKAARKGTPHFAS